ncbi:hypothetical protein D9M68_810670 [compost metagenome]
MRGCNSPAALRPACRTTDALRSRMNTVLSPLLVTFSAVATVNKRWGLYERMRASSISIVSVSGWWRASTP